MQFHERGEGHKAQVARRLQELTRKGEIDYRNQQQVNTDMKRMEEAALRAYHKDLTSNPDLTARVIIIILIKSFKTNSQFNFPSEFSYKT